MATAPGKPSIPTPGAADRVTQAAINNIRERLRQIDLQLAQLNTLVAGGASVAVVQALQRQVAQVIAAPPSSGGGGLTELPAWLSGLLLQPNGVVVLRDGLLVTRTLVAGPNILITNPNGYGGNIVISSTGGGGGTDLEAFYLTTEDGNALLTEDNLELMQEFRIDSSTALQDETGTGVELTTEDDIALMTE